MYKLNTEYHLLDNYPREHDKLKQSARNIETVILD